MEIKNPDPILGFVIESENKLSVPVIGRNSNQDFVLKTAMIPENEILKLMLNDNRTLREENMFELQLIYENWINRRIFKSRELNFQESRGFRQSFSSSSFEYVILQESSFEVVVINDII